VLEREMEDDPHNFTRFLLVARTPAVAPAEGAKTSLVFRLWHRPGSLHDALGVLRAYDADLTRLESRPIPGEPWEYRFYADLRGPSAERQRASAEALKAVATEVRVLGQYREEA
jgi:prephenate dehydratase